MFDMDNRSNILDKATTLFSEKGYDSVGVSELVAAAGVTKPTMYYYFKSKEGVLEEICREKFAVLNDALRGASAYNPKPGSYYEDVYPVLLKIVEIYFNFARDYSLFYRMVLSFRFMPPGSPPAETVRQYNEVQYGILEEMFADMATAHHSMRGRERRYSWSLAGMINMYIGLWYEGAAALNGEAARDAVKQFMHGVYT